MKRKYQQCTKCLLDTNDDPYIDFDEQGVCNHCRNCEKALAALPKGSQAQNKLERLLEKVKKDGKNKPYDIVTGVSGGVDSSFLAYLTKQWGLRTLCVHFDNGWNSELAVKNIEQIIQKLGFDLYTYVVDWEEFKEIQKAFFKADVVDIELVTDHAIFASLYLVAAKYKIKHIFNGNNIATEMILPSYWIHPKMDGTNVLDIYRKMTGKKKFKTYPYLNVWKKFKLEKLMKIQNHTPLNLIDYKRSEAEKILIEKLNWRPYGGKHYESVFTRFYQGYILPEKFGIIKRKAHLSNMICSGQITKQQAIEELKKNDYDPKLAQEDYEYVRKKLGFSQKEFEEYFKRPRREHSEFKTERPIYEEYPLLKPFKPIGDSIKKFLS